jgi:rubrerythrin
MINVREVFVESKTSEAWWNEVKNDNNKLHSWLAAQYHGEATAADRIEKFLVAQSPSEATTKTLQTIAAQELTHAEWVGGLMTARGLTPKIMDKVDRYWEETLPSIDSFEYGAAVAAHAEAMRLERIKAIASDEDSPDDIREVFTKILKDELWHERAFRKMAKSEMQTASENHAKGLEALGLII